MNISVPLLMVICIGVSGFATLSGIALSILTTCIDPVAGSVSIG